MIKWPLRQSKLHLYDEEHYQSFPIAADGLPVKGYLEDRGGKVWVVEPVADPDDLLPREAAASLLGIEPQSVHSTMRRAGIPHESGWRRWRVDRMRQPGRGYRTDLEDRSD